MVTAASKSSALAPFGRARAGSPAIGCAAAARQCIMAALGMLTLSSIPAAGARPAAVRTTVPPEYRGEWTDQPRYCGQPGDNLDSVLTVTASRVGYYESSWRVRRVRVAENGIFLTYWPRTDFTMYAPNQLRLSRDGKRIFTSDDRVERGTPRCQGSKR